MDEGSKIVTTKLVFTGLNFSAVEHTLVIVMMSAL